MEPGPSCEWFLIQFADEFSVQYGGEDSKAILDPTITGNIEGALETTANQVR
jgi:hypothetical protein